MTTTLTPIEKTELRINNSMRETYKPKLRYLNRRHRSFRYSERRLAKKMKMLVCSALADSEVYCPFFGHGGVTLAASSAEDAAPILTYMRYPVSYRRRMRYLVEWAKSLGDESTGVGMTVFTDDDEDTVKAYIAFAKNKERCVAAAKDADPLAIRCCGANNWDYSDN